MTTRTKAIYEDGVLKPLEKIELEEKEEIFIIEGNRYNR